MIHPTMKQRYGGSNYPKTNIISINYLLQYASSYDMDVDDSIRNRNFSPNKRAGKRSNGTENISTRRKRQMTSESKLPEIFRFFCNIEKVSLVYSCFLRMLLIDVYF